VDSSVIFNSGLSSFSLIKILLSFTQDPRWPQNGEHGHEFFDPGHDIHVHGNQYPGPAGTFINGAVYFSNPDFDDSYSDRSDQSDPKSVESAIKEGKAVTIYTGQQVVILPDAVNAEKALASQNH